MMSHFYDSHDFLILQDMIIKFGRFNREIGFYMGSQIDDLPFPDLSSDKVYIKKGHTDDMLFDILKRIDDIKESYIDFVNYFSEV